MLADYGSLSLTLGTHPMQLIRDRLPEESWARATDLANLPSGAAGSVAGIVLMRQHPGSAKGVTYDTVEDETGSVNIIVWPKLGDLQRRPLIESRLLEVVGELQREQSVTHVIAHRLVDRSDLLGNLLAQSRDFH
jgi:error-prone DNA polymerase